MLKRSLYAACLMIAMLCPDAQAADRLKLGFIASLSGPLATTGEEMQRGLTIALAELGDKVGGLPTTIDTFDDKAAPANAVQGASKLVYEDKIDIVTGVGASNVFLATVPVFVNNNVVVVGALAGPEEYAGKDCKPDVFVSSFQNDEWDEALGDYLNTHGYKRVYFIGLDFQAGWQHIGGARRTYKGAVAGQVFTPLTQLDFAAEIAQIRAANPDAIYTFIVGSQSISFVKQYAQAGLEQKAPIFGIDSTSTEIQWPAQGDAALGITVSTSWSAELDNPANQKFVAAFRSKFGRRPTIYAALQYDAVKLIDAAIRQIGGKVEDKEALRQALRKADFTSIRGPFRFNNNQFPIENIYVERVEKDAKGEMKLALKGQIASEYQDTYHAQCPEK